MGASHGWRWDEPKQNEEKSVLFGETASLHIAHLSTAEAGGSGFTRQDDTGTWLKVLTPFGS